MNGRTSDFSPSSSRCARRNGSVLVIVLITLLFATAALVAFIEKAGDQLIVDARESAAKRLRKDAYSAMEVSLAVLDEFRQVNGGLHSPAEGWNDPLGFAGWTPREGCTAEVTFEDESGKLSLPNIEPQQLETLLESWGLAQHDAERLRDALLGWMRKDYVPAESRTLDYEDGALPYTPPYRSLRTFTELAAIDTARDLMYDEHGRPNELWRRFASTFSLLDFKQTNINSAPPDLLDSLGWADRSQQQRIADYLSGTGDRAREGAGYFQTTSQAANLVGLPSLPNNFGTEISALRVTVVIHEGRTALALSTTVAPASGGASVVRPVSTDTTSSKLTDSTKSATSVADGQAPAATAANAASTPGGTAAAGTTQKLNYPFTLLEIREIPMISTPPVATTKA